MRHNCRHDSQITIRRWQFIIFYNLKLRRIISLPVIHYKLLIKAHKFYVGRGVLFYLLWIASARQYYLSLDMLLASRNPTDDGAHFVRRFFCGDYNLLLNHERMTFVCGKFIDGAAPHGGCDSARLISVLFRRMHLIWYNCSDNEPYLVRQHIHSSRVHFDWTRVVRDYAQLQIIKDATYVLATITKWSSSSDGKLFKDILSLEYGLI